MAARAFAYEYQRLERAPNGDLRFQIRAQLADDADPTVDVVLAAIAQVSVANPATWQNDFKSAVQAAAAALSPSISVTTGNITLLSF